MLPAGIAVGIEATTDQAVDAIEDMNDAILDKVNQAVIFETGKVNAKASITSNNSQMTLITIESNIEGNVDMDYEKVGRLTAPTIVKTIRTGGVTI